MSNNNLSGSGRRDFGSDNDNEPFYRGREPDDFRDRLADTWKDGEAAPAWQVGYRMVRLWAGSRYYYSVSKNELPRFCDWLAYVYPGDKTHPSRIIRGRRCIYVIRLPPYIHDRLGDPDYLTPGEFERLETRLARLFGTKNAATIIRDFFN